MKIPLPKSKNEYPFYAFIYWIIIWAFFSLYSIVIIQSSLTPDGKYVEKTDCLKKDKESAECIEYSKPYYVAAGTEIKYTFIQQGVYIGIGVITASSFFYFFGRASFFPRGRA